MAVGFGAELHMLGRPPPPMGQWDSGRLCWLAVGCGPVGRCGIPVAVGSGAVISLSGLEPSWHVGHLADAAPEPVMATGWASPFI